MLNLKALNKNQLEAVKRVTGNTLVLAGAGTGKTRVLTFRIAYLLENKVDPKVIYAFTFTNKAAKEMRGRLKYLGCDIDKLEISTFHSFCYSYLYHFAQYLGYQEKITIIDDDDKIKIIRSIIKDHNLEIVDTEIAAIISAVKNHTAYQFKNLKESFIANFIFHTYQETLKKYSKMDLDDLLYQFHKLLIQEVYIKENFQELAEYILVDECQDINNIQYEILLILSKIHNNLFLVGDQDQCIYAFRGSNIENINHFIEYKQAHVIKLEENYRSGKFILDVANNLIKNNKTRFDKNLYTTNTEQNFQVIYADLSSDKDEAYYTAKLIEKLLQSDYKYSDIVILYRNNYLSNNFEKELLKHQIPYQVFGSFPFFKHKEIKTIICYYCLLFNQDDDIALKEVYNTPTRGIGAITFQTIEIAAKEKNTGLFQTMRQTDNKDVLAFVKLIEELAINFKNMSPKEFINLLLQKIEYQKHIYKQQSAKTKINRIEEFIKMIEEIEVNDTPDIAIIKFLNEISLLNKQEEDKAFVKLMTIHQAKGLEFKIVIVAGCNEGILPSHKQSIKNIEEERRIFFVAITRARERLYLLSAKRRFISGKYLYLKPSTFLDDINLDTLLLDKFF